MALGTPIASYGGVTNSGRAAAAQYSLPGVGAYGTPGGQAFARSYQGGGGGSVPVAPPAVAMQSPQGPQGPQTTQPPVDGSIPYPTRGTYDAGTGTDQPSPPAPTPAVPALPMPSGGIGASNAMAQWLANQVGMSNTQYGQTNSDLMGQAATGQAYQQYLAGNAQSQYGISQGRTSLDQSNANSQYANLETELAGRGKNASATLAEVQRWVGNNEKYAGQDRDIQTWLNQRNNEYNLRGLEGATGAANLTAATNARHALYDETTRGAGSSVGSRLDQQDIQTQRQQSITDARLGYDKTASGLSAQQRETMVNYLQAMNLWQHHGAIGQEQYDDTQLGIQTAQNNGALANSYANQLAGLNGQQNSLNLNSALTGSSIQLQQLFQQLAQQSHQAGNANNQNIGQLWAQFLAMMNGGR